MVATNNGALVLGDVFGGGVKDGKAEEFRVLGVREGSGLAEDARKLLFEGFAATVWLILFVLHVAVVLLFHLGMVKLFDETEYCRYSRYMPFACKTVAVPRWYYNLVVFKHAMVSVLLVLAVFQVLCRRFSAEFVGRVLGKYRVEVWALFLSLAEMVLPEGLVLVVKPVVVMVVVWWQEVFAARRVVAWELVLSIVISVWTGIPFVGVYFGLRVSKEWMVRSGKEEVEVPGDTVQLEGWLRAVNSGENVSESRVKLIVSMTEALPNTPLWPDIRSKALIGDRVLNLWAAEYADSVKLTPAQASSLSLLFTNDRLAAFLRVHDPGWIKRCEAAFPENVKSGIPATYVEAMVGMLSEGVVVGSVLLDKRVSKFVSMLAEDVGFDIPQGFVDCQ